MHLSLLTLIIYLEDVNQQRFKFIYYILLCRKTELSTNKKRFEKKDSHEHLQ